MMASAGENPLMPTNEHVNIGMYQYPQHVSMASIYPQPMGYPQPVGYPGYQYPMPPQHVMGYPPHPQSLPNMPPPMQKVTIHNSTESPLPPLASHSHSGGPEALMPRSTALRPGAYPALTSPCCVKATILPVPETAGYSPSKSLSKHHRAGPSILSVSHTL